MEHLETGHPVRFHLGDVFCPPSDGALLELVETVLKATVTGRVAFVADAGEDLGRFAVIDVDGLPQRLVVAVDRLEARTAEPAFSAAGREGET